MILETYKKYASQGGFVVYNEPFRLNIWGFRASNQEPNSFDDEIHVFFNSGTLAKPVWTYHVFKCTTDPGMYWLKNPDSKKGTAILMPGQYRDVYGISKHQGKYKALCQVNGKVTVIRDHNRDEVLDFKNAKVQTGWFGINIHRASKKGTTLTVDKYSAGCQVFKNIKDFEFFLKLCDRHRKLYKNKFTYTLIDTEMTRKLAIAQVSKSFLSGDQGFGALNVSGEIIDPQFF